VRLARDVDAGHPDASRVERDKPGNGACERRLASAVFAHEPHDLTRADGEGEAAERDNVPKPFFEPLGHEHDISIHSMRTAYTNIFTG
jgi:hypothetical protein